MWDKIKYYFVLVKYFLFEFKFSRLEETEDNTIYPPLPPDFDIFRKTIKDRRKEKKIKRLTARSKYL